MKKGLPLLFLCLAALVVLSSGLMGQEQTEVSIKVKKDGKVVEDTTYVFDDASEAKHAVRMIELMSGENKHKEHVTYNYTTSHTGDHVLIVKSEDGNTFDIMVEKDCEGDDAVMKKEVKVVVSGDEDGNWTVVEGDEANLERDENVEVIVIKQKVDSDSDHDADHDEDKDKDTDTDEDVKVVIKKKKK